MIPTVVENVEMMSISVFAEKLNQTWLSFWYSTWLSAIIGTNQYYQLYHHYLPAKCPGFIDALRGIKYKVLKFTTYRHCSCRLLSVGVLILNTIFFLSGNILGKQGRECQPFQQNAMGSRRS